MSRTYIAPYYQFCLKLRVNRKEKCLCRNKGMCSVDTYHLQTRTFHIGTVSNDEESWMDVGTTLLVVQETI